MRWRSSRRSSNIEDRRGIRTGARVGIGGGAAVILAVIVMLLGGDPGAVIDTIGTPTTQTVEPGTPAASDEGADFVAAVLGETEDTWTALFRDMGRSYDPPLLVLFSDAVESACGMQSAAVGPFYCPADYKVYIDLSFYRELRERFGAPGDFAQAYVIAHEVGHHIQNLLGISQRANAQRARVGQVEANEISVRIELQADCLAGVWAHHAEAQRDLLEAGDIEEGMTAAAAIGDDRMQRNAGRAITPESWTHGSAAQRARWLRRGIDSGDINQCDTFNATI
jgi:predicted metalloprotease